MLTNSTSAETWRGLRAGRKYRRALPEYFAASISYEKGARSASSAGLRFRFGCALFEAMRKYDNFIDGQWVSANGKRTTTVNPADTRETVAEYPSSGAEETR